MSEQKPSVGRVVHYVAYGTPKGEYTAGAHRAAIITEVDYDEEFHDYFVSICILNPTGLFFLQGAEYDETGQKSGTWHWPERVE